jgi:hypothetical protein
MLGNSGDEDIDMLRHGPRQFTKWGFMRCDSCTFHLSKVMMTSKGSRAIRPPIRATDLRSMFKINVPFVFNSYVCTRSGNITGSLFPDGT